MKKQGLSTEGPNDSSYPTDDGLENALETDREVRKDLSEITPGTGSALGPHARIAGVDDTVEDGEDKLVFDLVYPDKSTGRVKFDWPIPAPSRRLQTLYQYCGIPKDEWQKPASLYLHDVPVRPAAAIDGTRDGWVLDLPGSESAFHFRRKWTEHGLYEWPDVETAYEQLERQRQRSEGEEPFVHPRVTEAGKDGLGLLAVSFAAFTLIFGSIIPALIGWTVAAVGWKTLQWYASTSVYGHPKLPAPAQDATTLTTNSSLRKLLQNVWTELPPSNNNRLGDHE